MIILYLLEPFSVSSIQWQVLPVSERCVCGWRRCWGIEHESLSSHSRIAKEISARLFTSRVSHVGHHSSFSGSQYSNSNHCHVIVVTYGHCISVTNY